MQLKKYIKISPHALRAYRLAASAWYASSQLREKNTLGFRHMMRILIDLSASGDRGSEKC